MEEKLSQALAVGVRPSGKDETRRHRVAFYLEKLTAAKLSVAYYEEMMRLEERRIRLARSPTGSLEPPSAADSEDFLAEWRALEIKERGSESRGEVIRTEAEGEGKKPGKSNLESNEPGRGDLCVRTVGSSSGEVSMLQGELAWELACELACKLCGQEVAREPLLSEYVIAECRCAVERGQSALRGETHGHRKKGQDE